MIRDRDEDLTPEEVKQRLGEMGIPTGQWENTEPEGDVEITTIPTFRRMADGLGKLGGLIEDQIKKDEKQIKELRLKLARLKHGGGR